MCKPIAACYRTLRLCALSALLLACQTQTAPTPTPTHTPPPPPTATVASPAATAIATPVPTLLPTTLPSLTKLVTVQDSLLLTLPSTWQTLAVDANGLENALAIVQQTGDGVDPAVAARLLAAVDPQSTALIAWLGDGSTASTEATTSLLVTMVPRQDLRLESYLASAQRELARQPGVTVHSAQVDVTLQTDGLPVALLHYTLPSSPTSEAVDGWQVTLFDQDAAHLLFLTFSTPSAQYPDHLPDFQAIVHSLQWQSVIVQN